MNHITNFTPLPALANRIINLSSSLFPFLATNFVDEPITAPLAKLIHILETIDGARYFPCITSVGAPVKDRQALLSAFIAKVVLNQNTTRQLIDRLRVDAALRRICGYPSRNAIPSESTFSRFFAEMARSQLPQIIHDQMIREHLGDKLIGHISRDGTAIHARERIDPRAKERMAQQRDAKKVKKQRGRPKRGEVRVSEPTRIERQRGQSVKTMMAEVPQYCDRGTKRNAQGHSESWNGYKLHLDTADCGVVISSVITAASVHDSQVAIALHEMSAGKVRSLYELMDSAYCSEEIRTHIEGNDRVVLVDHNKRRGEKIPFAPHEADRYKIRSGAERSNARLKDEFGGDKIYVRGRDKVFAHLMLGVLALSADQLLRLIT